MKRTKQQITDSYNKCYARYNKSMIKTRGEITECAKVELVMRSNLDKIWWFPFELIGEFTIDEKVIFIGYKAPARLYDLGQQGILESEGLGRFKVWRLK